MRTYNSNNAWKELSNLLPPGYQMDKASVPVEECWMWNGNRIHVDRYPNPNAEYRIFLHHGVGTNGRQLNIIFGHRMAALGYEVVAIDNLGYGMTSVTQKNIIYDDWVHCFADFVNHETRRDYKKTVLYGLSAGGMLVFSSSAYINEVHGIIGMCFLKNDDRYVGNRTAKFPGTNWFVVPLMKLLSKTALRTLPVPMKAVSKMNKLVNDRKALKIFLSDKASAGAKVQLQFLASYMTYKQPVAVEDFNKCPILLTQPAEDRWTPLKLSEISLRGLKMPLTVKPLEGGSHYPIEEKALHQLTGYAHEFIGGLG